MAETHSEAAHVSRALLVATAATFCVIATEWLHLGLSYLSVISVHIILSNPATTIFQKGLERILGRVLGIVFGLMLVMLFRETPLLFLLILISGMTVFFYIYFSGHLSYTGLQGGAFVSIVVVTGLTTPSQTVAMAENLIQQIVLGVAIALLLTGLLGADQPVDLPVQPLLWPLRADWLNKSLMLCMAMLATMAATIWFDLPVIPSMISAALLGMAPDPFARLTKALQRARGALLGSLYGFAGLILLVQMPHFILLLALTFLGMFISTYWTRASTAHSYMFLQMGMAIPMVLIGQSDELGSLSTGWQRFLGVWAGLLVSQAVEFLWPWWPASETASAEPASSTASR